MDSGKKQVAFSAGSGAGAPPNNNSTISSFTNDLFGSTDYNNSYSSSSSSFAEAFGSVFDPPPSKVFGGKTMRSEQARDQYSSSHIEASSGRRKGQDSNSGGMRSLDSIFQPHHQQQQQPPCHLSSSIYYGGQDVYPNPNPNTDGSFSNSSSSFAAKGEGEELDERDYASRGNWWQGSLYY